MRAWCWWRALWSRREHPRALGLVRILLGLAVLVDALWLRHLGLVPVIWGPADAGGILDGASWVVQLGPAWVHGTFLLAALCLTVGLFSRSSALVLLLLWTQLGQAAPFADRAADLLSRNALAILALSPAGAWGSVDAWWRTGSVGGTGEPEVAWPRYLIVAQLLLMYVTAGLQKTTPTWWPWNGATALFLILQDPAVTRMDFGFLRLHGLWRLTQLGTVGTLVWQLGYPLVLVGLALQRTRPVLGRALHLGWVGLGVVFHLGLAATMELGLFPWCMLALYPALIGPIRTDAGERSPA